MKITVEEIANLKETEVVIKCLKRTNKVEAIVDTLRLFDRAINAKREGQTHLIRPHDVYYFDSVDDKVYCYTESEVYETSYRLYELENALTRSTFLRVNKSIILNIAKIESCLF